MLNSVIQAEHTPEDLSSPLSRLELLDDSSVSYQVDNSIPFEVERTSDFALKNYVLDDIEYLLLTTLPTVNALNSLMILPPGMQDRIFKTLQQIYSHVTERTPSENTEYYFCHVAATVYYEEHTKIDIKGRQHYKKASSLTKLIENTLEEIAKLMQHRIMSPDQIALLQQYHYLFTAHNNACYRALRLIADHKKEHLMTHQRHNVDGYTPVDLSPSKKARVSSCHPQTSPLKPTKRTPKKLSPADKDSIQRIGTGVRLSFADLEDGSSSSEEEVVKKTKNSISSAVKTKRQLWQMLDDSEEQELDCRSDVARSSDDEFLLQQTDKLLSWHFDATVQALDEDREEKRKKASFASSLEDSFDYDYDSSEFSDSPEAIDSDEENDSSNKHKWSSSK